VLTLRPVDDWIESRRRHVEANQARQADGAYRGEFLTVDEQAWRDEWEQHVGRARSYFAGRSDFLEVDLTQGAAWGPLCDLLGVDPPAEPFPWANRGPSSQIAAESAP
jgi:hypothetical protein